MLSNFKRAVRECVDLYGPAALFLLTVVGGGIFLMWLATGAARAETIEPQRDLRAVSLEVVWFDDRRAVIRECAAMNTWNELALRSIMARHPAPGCTRFYPDSNRCVVYTMRPRSLDDAATTNLGHEVLHCLAGRYHE